MTRALLLFLFCFCFSTNLKASEAKAFALLNGVEKVLSDCRSYHLELSMMSSWWEPTNVGSNHEQLISFDCEDGKILMNSHTSSGQGTLTLMKRDNEIIEYKSANKSVRISDTEIAVKRGDEIYDPRTIALTDWLSVDKSIPECLLLERVKQCKVGVSKGDEDSLWVVQIDEPAANGEFNRWEFWIKEPEMLLRKKTYKSQKLNISITNSYENSQLKPFPSTIQVERIENGKKILDRHVKVTAVEKKRDFSTNFFDLKSFNLPLNTPVSDARIMRRLGYWDGEKIVPSPVSELDAAEREAAFRRESQFGWFRWMLMCGGFALVIISLGMKFWKKKG